MQCVLVYDIPDDGKRLKVADACLDYGMDRIQFSAFLGNLAVTHQEELMLRIKRILGKHAGNVQLFPICERDWAARQCVVIAAVQTTVAVQTTAAESSAAVKEEQEDAG